MRRSKRSGFDERPAAAQLFFSRFLLAGYCLTFTFSCTAVGFGALTTNRQTFSMTETTVASDV
jgi:hypothetical protein